MEPAEIRTSHWTTEDSLVHSTAKSRWTRGSLSKITWGDMSPTTLTYNEEVIMSKTALQQTPENSTAQLLTRKIVCWANLESWWKNASPQLTLPPANSWLHTWRWCLISRRHLPKSLIWSNIYNNHFHQGKISLSSTLLITRNQSLKEPESDHPCKKLWMTNSWLKRLRKWTTILWCKKQR